HYRMLDAFAPAELAGALFAYGGRSRCDAADPVGVWVCGRGYGFVEHDVGLIDGAFDSRFNDWFACETFAVAPPNGGCENNGISSVDDRLRNGRVISRALGFDRQVEVISSLCGLGQKIGRASCRDRCEAEGG